MSLAVRWQRKGFSPSSSNPDFWRFSYSAGTGSNPDAFHRDSPGRRGRPLFGDLDCGRQLVAADSGGAPHCRRRTDRTRRGLGFLAGRIQPVIPRPGQPCFHGLLAGGCVFCA